MARKPNRASGYNSEHREFVISTCLHLAGELGEFMKAVVVVGDVGELLRLLG